MMRETSMRDVEVPTLGSGIPAPPSGGNGDISHMLGHPQSDADDPFALLSPAGRTTSSGPVARTPAEPVDVLAQLQREAEAALRDPGYVSTHAMAVTVTAEPVATQTDADPFRSLTRVGQGKDSLLELLDGPASINGLAEPLGSLDVHELFALPPAPDVLRLFAGDIVPARRQDITAPLTRREHHLVSMDSAYRPAQVQEPGHGN